jgi:hypothetical protein
VIRDHERDPGAAADLARELDRAAMAFGDRAHDRETESDPTVLTRSTRVDPVEPVEDMRLLVGGDAPARILHPEANPSRLAGAPHRDSPAIGCMDECVVDQVDQRLDEEIFVRHRDCGRTLVDQGDVRARRRLPVVIQDDPNDRRKVDMRTLGNNMAGIRSGQGQKPRDQRRQATEVSFE